MAYTLVHNKNECKYEYHIDGFCAYITYDDKDDKMYLTHTIVPEELAGKGLARTLLEDVLQEIKKADKKAVSVCSYIVKYEEKHPELKALFTK